MTTKFGIEIEFLGMGDKTGTIKTLLRQKNLNVQTSLDAYENPKKDHWKITNDGSVYDEENCKEYYCDSCGCEGGGNDECDECYDRGSEPDQGAELVSPVLKYNQESFDEVKKALAILRHYDAYINETCGLHVHVDARFLQKWNEEKREKFLQYIIDEYGSIEPELDKKMDSSRREDNNEFCASMIGQPLRRVRGSRYYKLNVCAFIKHGTIEFRHHHGSLKDDEVIDWIKFCVNFMKRARSHFASLGRVEAILAANANLSSLPGFN